MICKNVKELIDTINHCCYIRDTDFEDGQVYVCNLCGSQFLSFSEVIEHILNYHKSDTIPDICPTK